MPTAIGIATIEGTRQEHVNSADEYGVTIRGEPPITITPVDATLHYVKADIATQAQLLKPLLEAISGLLDEGSHRQRDDQPVRGGNTNFGVWVKSSPIQPPEPYSFRLATACRDSQQFRQTILRNTSLIVIWPTASRLLINLVKTHEIPCHGRRSPLSTGVVRMPSCHRVPQFLVCQLRRVAISIR